MSNPDTWWWSLPDEERERLNRLARESILELDCYPYSSAAAAAELVEWSRLEADILEAHGAWLEKVRTSIERRGLEYNRSSFLRYCELREHE